MLWPVPSSAKRKTLFQLDWNTPSDAATQLEVMRLTNVAMMLAVKIGRIGRAILICTRSESFASMQKAATPTAKSIQPLQQIDDINYGVTQSAKRQALSALQAPGINTRSVHSRPGYSNVISRRQQSSVASQELRIVPQASELNVDTNYEVELPATSAPKSGNQVVYVHGRLNRHKHWWLSHCDNKLVLD